MKNLTLAVFILIFLAGCTSKQPAKDEKPDIIPVPLTAKMGTGNFEITKRTKILLSPVDEGSKVVAQLFSERLEPFLGKALDISVMTGGQPKNSILLELDNALTPEIGPEGYKLVVSSSRITIRAAKPAGLFYGIQTIYQLLPPEIFSVNNTDGNLKDVDLKVECVEITDRPSFQYRGMHLDVSRHFFPKEFIKKYIDLIAMHKMNVFHWHLTDDNGWRIQIDRYPLLTEKAAWRADRKGISWDDAKPQQAGEPATYGGFYTKDDIREIVEYARQRFVMIIPEIEMPGHTSEVFSAYPQYSCSGEHLTVKTGSYWPIVDIFCAGNDETYTFIQNILDEVIDLFPSPYIHIGGDEADKTAWRACPKCQAKIRQEKLSGVDELQSYFVKRMEKYIISKGKKMIGWDEILQGGLAPEATVMSWQGFEGGIESARQGHPVIMCPTSYCYFDYYQANPDFQPKAIGGLTTLKKVYSFRPVPSELSIDQRKLILGGQGNLWTEFIDTTSYAEYMVLPRMTALAEVLWSPEYLLNWNDFKGRLRTQFRRFDAMETKYMKGSGNVDVTALFNVDGKPYTLKLETEKDETTIYYTLNGYAPTDRSYVYKNPIEIKNDLVLKAVAFKKGNKLEVPAEYNITFHRGIGKNVMYKSNYSERYPGGGQFALVDGLRGSLNFNDGHWQGFNGKNAELIIYLGEDFAFTKVTTTFLLDQNKWIFYPDVVKYYISDDGQNFQQMAALRHAVNMNTPAVQTNDFSAKINKPLKTKYLKIEAVSPGVCPDWHPAKGQNAWIFLDEVVIN